jgi:pyridoxine/pyridoxamine 5'-phosphate oxidase
VNRPRLLDLAEIETAVWRELDDAVHGRERHQPKAQAHPWRVGVLATRDGDGVDARSVVLRELDSATRTLRVYTDARSPKARQIEAHPQGTLVLWSAALGWQLRLRVALTLETSGLAVLSRWARLKLTPAAQDYLSPLPPGTALDGPPDALAARHTPAHPARESREHFAVIAAEVQAIDWLELDARGHRRAVFEGGRARWVTP